MEESDRPAEKEGGWERDMVASLQSCRQANLGIGTSVAPPVKWQDRPGPPVYTSNAVLFSCAFLAY